MTLLWLVEFQCFKQECSGLLHFVKFEEDLDNCIDWSLWVACCVSDSNHFSKVDCCLGVVWHNRPQYFDEVRSMVHLLAVRNNLIELAGLNKSLDYLIWGSTRLEHFKSQLRVKLSNCIAKLITHCKFVFVDPIFNHRNPTLGENWTA